MSGARIVTAWDAPPDAHWWPIAVACTESGANCELCNCSIEPGHCAVMMLGDAAVPLATFLCTGCAPNRARALLLGSALSPPRTGQ
jgi:hypothetical protein